MEQFLLISDQDWTPAPAPDADERWSYAKPGEVGQLIAQLLPKTKKEKRSPDQFREFQGVVFDQWPLDDDLNALLKYVDAFRVVQTRRGEVDDQSLTQLGKYFQVVKQPWQLAVDDHEQVLAWVRTRLYGPQTGTKLNVTSLELAPWYKGPVTYEGFAKVEVEGDFGGHFRPLAYYRWGMYLDQGRTLALWPQFEKDPNVEVRLVVYECYPGNASTIDRRRVYEERDLQNEVLVLDTVGGGILSATLEVKGSGKLAIGALHYRWSRFDIGEFYPGGERIVDPTNRGEIDVYFNPGDLQPPLNIYFAGYRTAEGFEAYYMMRGFKSPFILVADPRLEGGAFYMGAPAFEQALKDKITEKREWLGFKEDQVNFMGISMGSFGAFYYGMQMRAHSIMVSKLLLSVGTIAKQEGADRFGGFPTSLDIINYHTKGVPADQKVVQMNAHFWDKFDQADLTKTKIAIAYMDHDDYDRNAYQDVLKRSLQNKRHYHVIGKSFVGKHGDDSYNPTVWLQRQIKTVLEEDFGRGEKNG